MQKSESINPCENQGEFKCITFALHSFYSIKTDYFISQNLYCLSSSKRERLLGLDDHLSHPPWILMNKNKYKLLLF